MNHLAPAVKAAASHDVSDEDRSSPRSGGNRPVRQSRHPVNTRGITRTRVMRMSAPTGTPSCKPTSLPPTYAFPAGQRLHAQAALGAHLSTSPASSADGAGQGPLRRLESRADRADHGKSTRAGRLAQNYLQALPRFIENRHDGGLRGTNSSRAALSKQIRLAAGSPRRRERARFRISRGR